MTARPATLLKSAAAAAVAVAVVAGVPVLLVGQVGWPLPTSIPTADGVAAALRTGLAPDTAINTLAVVVWIAWSQLTLALAAETVAVVRNRPVRGPVLPGARHAAAQLIGTILLVATTTTTARPALALEPLATAAATQPVEPPTPATPAAAATGEGRVRLVTVGPRDSWWRLAETHLGDGLRWQQLRDLNQGRTVGDGTTITAATDVIHPGWQIAVPTTSDDDHHDAGGGDDAGSTWTVQQGDNLWDIAERHLAATDGHQPHDAQTAAYWQELIEANRHRLVDEARPDHILPGQQLLLPAAAPPAAHSSNGRPSTGSDRDDPAATNGARPTQAPATPTAPDAPDRHADTSTAAEPPKAAGESASPPAVVPGAVEQANPAADQPAPPGDRPADPPHDETDAEAEDGWVLPPALAATALIAAGVMQTLRRRRRAAYTARRAGMRFPTPHPGRQQAAEARLDVAAAPEAVLDGLWELLRTIPDDAAPTLVVVRDDAVTLTFDQPPGDPPPPWTPPPDGDGGGEWTAAPGHSGPSRSVGLPLLVTLGHTDTGGLLLANIPACGPLHVTGDPDDVRTRLRTMSLEVATSPIAHTPDVVVLGDDLLDHLDRIRHVDDPDTAIADCVTAVARGTHPEDRTPILLVCHDDRNLQLPACTDIGLIRAATDPDTDDGATLLTLDGPDRGVLQLPDGTPQKLHLPDVDPETVHHTLTALDHPVLHIDDRPDEPTEPASTDHGPSEGFAAGPVDGPTWCQVRLLGPVDVLIDDQPVPDLPPKPLELLLYLATHRDSATTERVTDALWPGVPPRSAAERARKNLTRLRAALGDGPDGQLIVPHRTRGGDGRIQLSPHLSTDLDRALGHLEAARRAPEEQRLDRILSALDHVRGEPFQTLPLSWATEVTQRAIVELQDAAQHAARLAITQQRHDDGVRVLRQALRLLPGTEMLYLTLAEVEIARGRPEAANESRREFFEIAGEDDLDGVSCSDAWNALGIPGLASPADT